MSWTPHCSLAVVVSVCGVVDPGSKSENWNGNAPGMKTVQDISRLSDPSGTAYRPVHYLAAVCTALFSISV